MNKFIQTLNYAVDRESHKQKKAALIRLRSSLQTLAPLLLNKDVWTPTQKEFYSYFGQSSTRNLLCQKIIDQCFINQTTIKQARNHYIITDRYKLAINAWLQPVITTKLIKDTDYIEWSPIIGEVIFCTFKDSINLNKKDYYLVEHCMHDNLVIKSGASIKDHILPMIESDDLVCLKYKEEGVHKASKQKYPKYHLIN